jgi:hypothetical protein
VTEPGIARIPLAIFSPERTLGHIRQFGRHMHAHHPFSVITGGQLAVDQQFELGRN